MIFTTLIGISFGFHLRFGPKCRALSTDKVNQGIDVTQVALHGNADKHGVTFSKPRGIAYDNSAYVSVEQATASARQGGIIPIKF